LSDNMLDFSLTKKMLKEFEELASRYKKLTDALIKDVETAGMHITDSDLLEISRLNVNCYITQEYISDLLETVHEDRTGSLKLYPQEEANLVKCVRALIESRQSLLDSNISLEIH